MKLTLGTYFLFALLLTCCSDSNLVDHDCNGEKDNCDTTAHHNCEGNGVEIPDLVAYYPFNNGSVMDHGKHLHNGVLHGGTIGSDRFDRAECAMSFDGESDYITIPASPDFDFGQDDEFSLCAWIYLPDTQSDFAGIVCKGPPNSSYTGYQMVIRVADSVGPGDHAGTDFSVATSQKKIKQVTGSSIAHHAWTFLAWTVSTTTGESNIYVDGQLKKSGTFPNIDPSILNDAPLYIGTERNRSAFFKGKIDDVRIFNRALTDTEIRRLYHENGW